MIPIRVLIVDDSSVVREHLSRIVSADPRLVVAGIAASGEEAIAMVDRVMPDVISMDIQLPGIEGFEATRRIMAHRPTPIVIVSGVDVGEVSLTMKALRAGALSIVEKPVSSGHEDYQAMASRLCTQLFIMSQVKVIRRRENGTAKFEPALHAPQAANKMRGPYRLLAIAASTGGPNAIVQLLNGLGNGFPLPIVVVQHMNAGFMEGFAEWMSNVTPFSATVVDCAAKMVPGNVYVASGDRHLAVETGLALPDGRPPVGGHRPSANVLFSSAARNPSCATIGVLLTGMGEDGATGLGELSAAGGYTIAEDETTAVVYGMPAAAVRAGAARESLALHRIAPRILDLIATRKDADR